MNLLKAASLAIGTIALSGLLAMQAFTNILANDKPALAASVSPLNGFALEQVALDRLQSQEGGSLTPLVRQVLAKEPLSPAAWTILALSQQDADKKDAILLAASKINRRTLLLQSSLLLLYASRDDFSNSIGVLNQILTVYPEQEATMFPILIQALKNDRAIPEFVQTLSKKPVWSDNFLEAASQDSDALPNLARVRMGLFGKLMVEQDTDKTIIAALVKAGRTETAASLYRKISEPAAGSALDAAGSSRRIDWSTNMPPFDWQLTDNAEQRAQIIESPERLEIFVRSGKAGVLAERILTVPSSFALQIRHSVTPIDQLKDVRIQIQCEKTRTKFFDQPLTPSPSKFAVGPITPDCRAVRLSLLARAWSNKASISGTIDSINIIP